MKKNLFYGFIGIFFLVSCLFYWTSLGGNAAFFFRTVGYFTAPFIALTTGFAALQSYKFRIEGPYARILFFWVIGVAAWCLGEAIWSYFDYVSHTDPFPSIADFFYILAYPAFLISLVLSFKTERSFLKAFDPLRIASLLLSFSILTVLVLYFGVYLAYDTQGTFWENFFRIGYGIGDLVLLISCLVTLMIFWETRKGERAWPWLFFFCGLISILTADILFAIFELKYEAKLRPYYPLTDCLWILGYLSLAASFFEFRLFTQRTQKDLKKFSLK